MLDVRPQNLLKETSYMRLFIKVVVYVLLKIGYFQSSLIAHHEKQIRILEHNYFNSLTIKWCNSNNSWSWFWYYKQEILDLTKIHLGKSESRFLSKFSIELFYLWK